MKVKTVVITGCTRGLGRAMIPGVVVNFSSGWGRSTAAGVAPYCATKFAIEGLSMDRFLQE